MRVVMTLCVENDEEILDAHLAFHLRAGVDFVVATDLGSTDESVEVLRRYAAAGYLQVLRGGDEPADRPAATTRMARLAASEFGADWVLNSSTNEFWYPRSRSLKDALETIPSDYGIVRCARRQFVPGPEGPGTVIERLTVRLVAIPPTHDPTSPFRPSFKVAHRGDPHIRFREGGHEPVESSLISVRGWSPIEILCFPAGSRGVAAHGETEQFVVSDERVASGVLAVDTRLRDLLATVATDGAGRYVLPSDDQRLFEPAPPSILDDAMHAQELAALGDADLVSAQRRLDRLERLVARQEEGSGVRLARKVSSLRRSLFSNNGR
jgi:hypothetical protein